MRAFPKTREKREKVRERRGEKKDRKGEQFNADYF
jgi:hypothetical protein